MENSQIVLQNFLSMNKPKIEFVADTEQRLDFSLNYEPLRESWVEQLEIWNKDGHGHNTSTISVWTVEKGKKKLGEVFK